ncbi:MAG: hypothetical protein NTZ35_09825 [Ignavibacteriales bacterium]|nr:hypothetical protein [Ignavibacteriales bacterium]
MTLPAPEPIESQGYTIAHLFSALPSFFLSGMFLITWIAPEALGEKTISYLMLVMLLEFINVHAAGFMGNTIISESERGKKAMTIIGLGVFYTLFVGAFALTFKQWWPLWAFWGLVLNRLLGVLLGKAPTGQEKNMIQTSWGIGVFCYVMLVFATIILPVPAFGVTSEVIAKQGFTMRGLWIDEPYRMMAFGFLYFAVIGLTELFSYKWTFQGGNVGQFFRRS